MSVRQRLQRLVWSTIVIAASVATSPKAASAAPGNDENTPVWLHRGWSVGSTAAKDAGAALIGRQFAFTPYSDKLEPRYGRLTLLTFTADALRERRPMLNRSYRIEYGDRFFNLPDARPISALNPDAFRKGGPPANGGLRFGDMEVGGGKMYLMRALYDGPTYAYGFVREVTPDVAKEIEALIDAAEAGERKQHELDAEKVKAGGAAPYVDLSDQLNGDLLEEVYHGRFFPKPTRDANNISGPLARLKMMYVDYHYAHGERYGGSGGEAWTKITERMVTRDRFGNEIDRQKPHDEYYVRTRYLKSFRYAQGNTTAAALDAILKMYQGKFTWEDLVHGDAAKAFLDRYGSSPATVDRFEENLEAYLYDREPKYTDEYARAPYAASARWRPKQDAQASSHQGLNYVVPGEWNKKERFGKHLIASYASEDAKVEVSFAVFYVPLDLLRAVNSNRASVHQPKVTSLDEVALESIQLGTRTAHIHSYELKGDFAYAGTRAFIADGQRYWDVLMIGDAESVKRHRPELDAFIKSFDWTDVDQSQLDQWAAERKAQTQTPPRPRRGSDAQRGGAGGAGTAEPPAAPARRRGRSAPR